MWKNDILWFEIGSGFGQPGATLPPRIPRSTPQDLPFFLAMKPKARFSKVPVTFWGPKSNIPSNQNLENRSAGPD